MPVYIWDLPTDQYGEMIIVIAKTQNLQAAWDLVAAERPNLLDRIKDTPVEPLYASTGPTLLVYEVHQ